MVFNQDDLDGAVCWYCGLLVEPKGGQTIRGRWACSYCVLNLDGDMTPDEQEEAIRDYGVSLLLNFPQGMRLKGSGRLVEPAAGICNGSKRWGHVDRAALKTAFRAAYPGHPMWRDDADRMREAVEAKKLRAADQKRKEEQTKAAALKKLRDAQKVLESLGVTSA